MDCRLKMKCYVWGAILALCVTLIGCGGEEVTNTATVTGTVVDIDFNPVRDAIVSTTGAQTKSSTTGAYQLINVPTGELTIFAETVQNGVVYRGRNTVFNSENRQTNSTNILVGPVNELGIIRGNVKDLDGFNLENASVFAYCGAGSSQRTFTDRDGNYVLRDLIGGVTYTISATGQGFSSDQVDVTVPVGGQRTINLVMGDADIPFLDPPQNVGATSWVSHVDPTRSLRSDAALTWVKNFYDKGAASRKKAMSRAIRGDRIVEVDIFWDAQQFPDLLGYGVYRASSASGTLVSYDYLPEPLAGYYVDIGPEINSTYSYALTSLATLFPQFNQTESALSDRVVVDTLNIFDLLPVSNNLRFSWTGGSGAEEYIVFVFDEFPGLGISSFWNTANTPTQNTFQDYNGPALIPGRTYYYLVLGLANGSASRTISQIGSFQP